MPAASVAPRRRAPAAGDSDAQCLVRIAGLQKIYKTRDGNDIHALKDIDLDIRAAEFISIVGPSGCGKTTLLKILAGILNVPPARWSWRGAACSGPSRELGVVFQAPVLLPWRTVLQNVMVPIQVQRRDRAVFEARARAADRHGRAHAASSTSIRASSRAACSSASAFAARWCTTLHSC